MKDSALTFALVTAFAWGVWVLLVKLATRTLEPAMAMIISYSAAVITAVYIVTSGGFTSVTMAGTGYAVLGGVAASGGAVAFYRRSRPSASGSSESRRLS